MRFGFFPPNSKDNFLNIGAAILEICAPVWVPPVKEMAFISGCSTIACPAFEPTPCTIFKTPGGSPASRQISLSNKAVIGVTSLGFATTQFPVASAGAIFQEKRYKGKFHGEIQPTTPRGLLKVKLKLLFAI